MVDTTARWIGGDAADEAACVDSWVGVDGCGLRADDDALGAGDAVARETGVKGGVGKGGRLLVVSFLMYFGHDMFVPKELSVTICDKVINSRGNVDVRM